MLLTADARGVYAIAPTPFFEDGRIDSASIDRLTDFYLGIGATGIAVLGQLGEALKLAHAESVAVARQMVRRASALPVVVGVSAPGFAAMRALTHEVMAAGAAGLMIAPPTTLRSDDQIVGYCRQALAAIGADAPFVLQGYPIIADAPWPARQRQPAAPLTREARAEVDHLLQRLAQRDPRARLP